MKLTLQDLLALESFRGARVLSAHSKLGNVIESVSLLKGGSYGGASVSCENQELTLAVASALGMDLESQVSNIEKLGEGGCSGLIIFPVYGSPFMPHRKVIETAEVVGLPLILPAKEAVPGQGQWMSLFFGGLLEASVEGDGDGDFCTGLESNSSRLSRLIYFACMETSPRAEKDSGQELLRAFRQGNRSLIGRWKEVSGIKTEEILGVFYARGLEKNEPIQQILAFEEGEKMQIIRLVEAGETYGMVVSKEALPYEGLSVQRNKCIDLFNRLKEEKSTRIFHVTGVEGEVGAIEGFRLIAETRAFVQVVFPYKRVFTKYELALVSNCINIRLQGSHVKRNYLELLEPFMASGEGKGRQLLETLETFVLDAGMNSSKTSEFMGIHTNTVQYRLKKINEALGVEITGNRVIPGLTIALALRRLDHVT